MLVYWFVRLITLMLKKKTTVFQISVRNIGLLRQTLGSTKTIIEAIDSKEMRRRENLGTRLPLGYSNARFSC